MEAYLLQQRVKEMTFRLPEASADAISQGQILNSERDEIGKDYPERPLGACPGKDYSYSLKVFMSLLSLHVVH